MNNLKLLLLLLSITFPAAAQQQAIPLRVEPMAQAPVMSAPTPVVIELFSSQACTYCPAADAFMSDLVEQQGIIGLSCHVDYFDVKRGSLSKKFCTARQKDYKNKMALSSLYTPQMVVNGHMDVIGYEGAKVTAAIFRARAEKMGRIDITEKPNGSYAYTLPAQAAARAAIYIALFDKPHTLTVAEGGNRGKKMTYHNIVTSLMDVGAWDGAGDTRYISPLFTAQSGGFAVLAQDAITGKIIAAGMLQRN